MVFCSGDLNYLECFAKLLKQYMILRSDIFLFSNYLAHYIRNVISNAPMLFVKRDALEQKFHWCKEHQLVVIVASPLVASDLSETGILSTMQKLKMTEDLCCIIDNNKNIVLLVNRTRYAKLEEVFDILYGSFSVPIRIGISMDFNDYDQIRDHYDNAKLAMSYCDDENMIVLARDIISKEIRHQLLSNPDLLPYVHPVLRILHAYDKRDNTKLLQTLRCFVFSECNYSECAKKMYISRNTLIQQIGKIVELTSVDFNDYEQFQAILYSFIIYKDVNPF
jgi:sugar diacid utilization regulator